MDDIERGQLHEQLNRDIALRNHAMRTRAETPADGLCVECAAPIELDRIRVLGDTDSCAECARVADLQARIGGRRV